MPTIQPDVSSQTRNNQKLMIDAAYGQFTGLRGSDAGNSALATREDQGAPVLLKATGEDPLDDNPFVQDDPAVAKLLANAKNFPVPIHVRTPPNSPESVTPYSAVTGSSLDPGSNYIVTYTDQVTAFTHQKVPN